MENHEDELLNQVENDIDTALEDGEVKSEQYTIEKVDDSTVRINDVVNDEVTLASVDDESMQISLQDESEKRAEELRAECDSRGFSGTIKDGNLYARIQDVDIVFDFKKGEARNADNERQKWSFKPNTPFTELIDKIEADLKKSSKSRTFTAKHTEDHLNNTKMNNLANLSPEAQAFVKEQYKRRHNKTRNFSKKVIARKSYSDDEAFGVVFVQSETKRWHNPVGVTKEETSGVWTDKTIVYGYGMTKDQVKFEYSHNRDLEGIAATHIKQVDSEEELKSVIDEYKKKFQINKVEQW